MLVLIGVDVHVRYGDRRVEVPRPNVTAPDASPSRDVSYCV